MNLAFLVSSHTLFLGILIITGTNDAVEGFSSLAFRARAATSAVARPLPNIQRQHDMRRSNSQSALLLGSTSSSSISSNEDLLPGIQAIDQGGNQELLLKLEALREAPDFRFFSVDILASCEYMPQELFECYTEGCEILPIDEEDVPETIRGVDMAEYDFDLDGWGRWDMPTEDYYDVQGYPEGYTGYDGSEVWNFIHNRICFEGFEYSDDHWKADFNKAVSGLHSMISAQIIRGIQEKIDMNEEFSETEVWTDPRVEFERRLSSNGEVPLARENLYFLYMLLLSAVAKSRDRLLEDCNSGRIEAGAAEDLKSVYDSALLLDDAVPAISAAAKKLKMHATKDSGCLWEARMRTRELIRIMNCVQCNKCRLHGKISTMGLSTALQILLGKEGEGCDPKRINRVELSTLMTTLHKTARAIDFCQSME
mmetsp:Transcript_7555/g.9880  ORF Transcript_7555/g.9880 Transcript_7555/m.9880 type:complete len:425 (-) Transcript_7555:144-1418(-)|eukprot:CAMPEP_0198143908 /NCGR_PEP_ID=MMETSP1443-20131203/11588_1 /TAXON_ID=186043 /ORGANISM="Entomoneis sp., Strain CCMP2396" /LENGTH=424 /DNA_ID=CAMNT_0043807213 /DNA_START=169 /DNA_END=1443 /DNA_ORIENTATION=-